MMQEFFPKDFPIGVPVFMAKYRMTSKWEGRVLELGETGAIIQFSNHRDLTEFFPFDEITPQGETELTIEEMQYFLNLAHYKNCLEKEEKKFLSYTQPRHLKDELN